MTKDIRPMPWEVRNASDDSLLCDGCGLQIKSGQSIDIRHGEECDPAVYNLDPAYFHSDCVQTHAENCACIDCTTFERASGDERLAIHLASHLRSVTLMLRNRGKA